MQQLPVDQLAAFAAAHPGTVVLDVREPWEIATAALRLPGTTALDIPMNEVPRRLGEIPSSQPVVCLCHHGMRSAQVVAFLMRQGRTSVYNLAGGIDAWSARVDATVPRY